MTWDRNEFENLLVDMSLFNDAATDVLDPKARPNKSPRNKTDVQDFPKKFVSYFISSGWKEIAKNFSKNEFPTIFLEANRAQPTQSCTVFFRIVSSVPVLLSG